MKQYKTLNKNLSNSQYNKLESGIKSATEVNLKLSSNVFEVLSFLKFLQMAHELIEIIKIQLHKIRQSDRFLGRTTTKNWNAFNEKCT